MFRNFYIQTADGSEVDALSDGDNSCAFYVSSVLTLFGKHSGVHGTVRSTVTDLYNSGWQPVEQADIRPGDVIVWDDLDQEGAHIGFYIGEGRAVSTSSTEKKVVEHDAQSDFRAIGSVFRHQWEA